MRVAPGDEAPARGNDVRIGAAVDTDLQNHAVVADVGIQAFELHVEQVLESHARTGRRHRDDRRD